MREDTQRLLPGQIRGFGLRRHTLLLALDGPLHLTYRDAALDWLPGGAPRMSIRLDEGAAHRMPCAAWVEAGTDAAFGATLGITSSPVSASLRGALARAVRIVLRRRVAQASAPP